MIAKQLHDQPRETAIVFGRRLLRLSLELAIDRAERFKKQNPFRDERHRVLDDSCMDDAPQFIHSPPNWIAMPNYIEVQMDRWRSDLPCQPRGYRPMVVYSQTAPPHLAVTVDNYGKTPAFIGTIRANIVPENELPAVNR